MRISCYSNYHLPDTEYIQKFNLGFSINSSVLAIVSVLKPTISLLLFLSIFFKSANILCWLKMADDRFDVSFSRIPYSVALRALNAMPQMVPYLHIFTCTSNKNVILVLIVETKEHRFVTDEYLLNEFFCFFRKKTIFFFILNMFSSNFVILFFLVLLRFMPLLTIHFRIYQSIGTSACIAQYSSTPHTFNYNSYTHIHSKVTSELGMVENQQVKPSWSISTTRL